MSHTSQEISFYLANGHLRVCWRVDVVSPVTMPCCPREIHRSDWSRNAKASLNSCKICQYLQPQLLEDRWRVCWTAFKDSFVILKCLTVWVFVASFLPQEIFYPFLYYLQSNSLVTMIKIIIRKTRLNLLNVCQLLWPECWLPGVRFDIFR